MNKADILLNMEKEDYRDKLLKLKPYINLSGICKNLNITQSNVSSFLVSGDNQRCNIQDLKIIYYFIKTGMKYTREELEHYTKNL